MSTRQLPSVELIQGTAGTAVGSEAQPAIQVFFGVLVVALAVGLAIVCGRSPVYPRGRLGADGPPKTVDARSAEADTEHVVIQGRLLMGEDLLGRLSRRLAAEGDEIAGMDQPGSAGGGACARDQPPPNCAPKARIPSDCSGWSIAGPSPTRNSAPRRSRPRPWPHHCRTGRSATATADPH